LCYGVVGVVQDPPLVWIDIRVAGIHFFSSTKFLAMLPDEEKWF
jgi:hypothetical protein